MSAPKISIVIPAYNESAVIEQAISAVRAQDYPNFEVVVVNNASTDDTGEKAARAGARVVYEVNKGLIQARSAGYKATDSPFIANMDADCIPPPDWLTRSMKYFASPEIVAVTGGYYLYDLPFLARELGKWWIKLVHRNLSHYLQWRKRGAYMLGGNVILRRSALDSIGGYNLSLRFWGEDIDTAIRLSTIGKVFMTSDTFIPSSGRRLRENGYLKTMRTYFASDRAVFERYAKFLEEFRKGSK